MKLFKIFLTFIFSLFSLCVIAIIATTMIDPNTFKPFIIGKVQKLTGKEMVIKGPLKWHFTPNISVELNQIELKNTSDFQGPFLQIDSIHLSPRWTSLLAGKLLLAVDLNNPSLYLTTLVSGQNNWHSLQQPTTSSTSSASKVIASALSVKNALIYWTDKQNKKEYVINVAALKANQLERGFLGSSTPFSIETTLQGTKLTPINLNFKTNWKLKKHDHLIADNMQLNVKLPHMSSFQIIGNFELSDFKTDPLLIGNASCSHLNVSPFIVTSLQTTDFSKKNIPLDLKVQFSAKKNQFNINPYILKVANSTHTGQLKIHQTNQKNRLSFTQKADSFEIQPLLTLLQHPAKIQGKASSTLQITTLGNTIEQCVKNLSGKLSMQIEKGAFLGFDLLSLLEQAQKSIKELGKTLSGKDQLLNVISSLKAKTTNLTQQRNMEHAKTSFDSLTATAFIKQGVLNNSDLKITHPRYQITGQGAISLSQKTMNYNISALLTDESLSHSDKISHILKNTPLTIRIQGTFDNPTIQPDLEKYTHTLMKVAPEKIIEQFSGKLLDKVLGF